MFCPQCGISQSDDLKFCKQCGANLQAVRQVATREPGGTLSWDKTWVAEMFMSQAERTRREHELEQIRGITPAVKRYQEIKAGVIVSAISLALMIFLSIFMEGIVLGGKVPEDTAAILSRIWIAGILPLFIGLAMIVNGLFVSKKLVALAEQEERARAKNTDALEPHTAAPQLQSAETTEFVPANFSVTEDTTKHLKTSR
jgi:predicted phage tail protein